MSREAYEYGLDRSPANHLPLTPLGFLDRAALVHPSRVAVIHGDLRRTWAETRDRAFRLASALVARGIGKATRFRFYRLTRPRCSKRITVCLYPARF